MVVPGTYKAELVVTQGGQQRSLAEPVSFNVERLREGSLKGASLAQMEAFNNELSTLYGQSQAARYAIKAARKELADLGTMVSRMRAPRARCTCQAYRDDDGAPRNRGDGIWKQRAG
jgi:hypothetical protein